MNVKKNTGIFASSLFIIFGACFLTASLFLSFRMISKGANATLNITTFVFVFMGAVYLFIGSMIYRACHNTPARLMSITEPIYATITQLCEDDKAKKVRGKAPHYLVCTAAAEGQRRVFESYGFFTEPPADIIGKQIKVYIDPQNPKNYYVDLNDCLSEKVSENFND